MGDFKIEISLSADSLVEAREVADRIDGESFGGWRFVVRESEPERESEGVYCEGCEHCVFPGVRWPSTISGDSSHEWVERCDLCERFASDEAARDWLIESYGPETIEREFEYGHAKAVGLNGLRPYLDGPLHDRASV
jgi:hypothetical protein